MTPDDYNAAVFAMIADMRGGVPEKCDFCEQPYIEKVRWPLPEEGGEWACNECYARWGEGDAIP